MLTRRLADLVVVAGDMSPDELRWLYIKAVIIIEGNISTAARRLGMHRRTIQRLRDRYDRDVFREKFERWRKE